MALSVQCPQCQKSFNIFPCRLRRNTKFPPCCSHQCGSLYRKGISNARFVGQKRTYQSGYVFIPQGRPYVKAKREHIIVAEKALGRALKPTEVVHHIDLDKSNNNNNNLLICTQAYHAWLHQEMARRWVREHING